MQIQIYKSTFTVILLLTMALGVAGLFGEEAKPEPGPLGKYRGDSTCMISKPCPGSDSSKYVTEKRTSRYENGTVKWTTVIGCDGTRIVSPADTILNAAPRNRMQSMMDGSSSNLRLRNMQQHNKALQKVDSLRPYRNTTK